MLSITCCTAEEILNIVSLWKLSKTEMLLLSLTADSNSLAIVDTFTELMDSISIKRNEQPNISLSLHTFSQSMEN